MKKFLSLVLALVMTMSLVTISAGADFTDDSSINYAEAVDVMSAVGVVGGYADGSFNPQGTLTRGAAAKIICNMIRGKNAKLAMALLENTPKAGAELMIKVLKSAMANAESNFEMDPEKLYVSTCFVAPGPIMKRIRFVSRAGVHRIEKRTSHITVAVSER